MHYQFVLRLAFLLAWSAAGALSGLGQTAVPPRQLTLIRPSDAGFDSLLTANFPGIESLDGYAVYRPFLVLLRNDTAHTVRAYMLQWQLRLTNGQPWRLADLIERYDLGLASERVALAPGEVRLVSDTFDVNPAEFQSTHQHNWVATMLSTVATRRLYTSADPNSITASVDAAVFDDDTCAGPDHHHVCQRLQAEMDAERDVAQELLQLLDKNAAEADVVAYLKTQTDASAKASAILSGAAFDRAFWRGRQAEKLLTLHQRGGLESVMVRAWKVTQQPRRTLSPVSAQSVQ